MVLIRADTVQRLQMCKNSPSPVPARYWDVCQNDRQMLLEFVRGRNKGYAVEEESFDIKLPIVNSINSELRQQTGTWSKGQLSK